MVFDAKILDPEILEEDNYWLIEDEESRDATIEQLVLSPVLREHLLKKSQQWNIHIRTSHSLEHRRDVAISWMYLYDCKQTVFDGRPAVDPPKSGEIDPHLWQNTQMATELLESCLAKIPLPENHCWKYGQYWIVAGSW